MLAEHSDLEAYVKRELPRHGEISLAEPDERRTEARYPTLKTGTIHPVDPAGRESMTAYVMDISKHGMKVRVERAFEPGDRVRDLGGVTFFDLRDRSGLLQVMVDPAKAEAFLAAAKLGNTRLIDNIELQ